MRKSDIRREEKRKVAAQEAEAAAAAAAEAEAEEETQILEINSLVSEILADKNQTCEDFLGPAFIAR